MTMEDIRAEFDRIRESRRQGPGASLDALGSLAEAALGLMAADCQVAAVRTQRIPGAKEYGVFHGSGRESVFSRPLNRALLIQEASTFRQRWTSALDVMTSQAGSGSTTVPSTELDSLFYTAVMAYAAVTDVFNAGNRGGPGTLLEIAVGSTVALLTGLEERGGIALNVDGFDAPINVTVDMTFGDIDVLPVVEAEDTLDEGYIVMDAPDDIPAAPTAVDDPVNDDGDAALNFEDGNSGAVLVIPTKLSTRERIVQAYAHQRILDVAKPGKYKTVLCACNENNLMKPSNQVKRLSNVWVTDTLVPKTIVLYELYVAKLAAIYYLDPPPAYLEPRWRHFPHVSTFGDLVSNDLRNYLTPAGDR